MNAQMDLFVWGEGPVYVKEEWRSVLKAGGEQYVTVAGTVEMHLLCADSWDTLHWVSEEWLQSRVQKVHSQFSTTL